MGAFRSLLVAVFIGIGFYTGVVIGRHGVGLLPVFSVDIATIAWPGQFNLDFLCMLTLSGLWAWHGDTASPSRTCCSEDARSSAARSA